jgi:hypothetical protein
MRRSNVGCVGREERATMPRPTPEESAGKIVGILKVRSADPGHVDLVGDVKSSFLASGGDEQAFAEGVEFGGKEGWFSLSGPAIRLTPAGGNETK